MADQWDAFPDAPVKPADPWSAFPDAPKSAEATGAADPNVAALQQGQKNALGGYGPDPSYLERQIYSNLIKGVAGLPGLPGYFFGEQGVGERGAEWAAKKFLTPEQYEVFQQSMAERAPPHIPLPMPETFIKPVEEYVTGPLPEEDPNKPLQNIAASTIGMAPFGPAGMVAGFAGKTAETLAPEEYKEAAGLAGMFLGPAAARTAGNAAARSVAARLGGEKKVRAKKAEPEEAPPPAENTAQITQEHIDAAPETPQEVPPFGFGREGVNPNVKVLSPEVSHNYTPTGHDSSVGAQFADDILAQTSPEARQFLGDWFRSHYNENTLEDAFERQSPQETLAELNDDSKAMTAGLISHPGLSRVETKGFFDQRHAESRERRDIALNEAFGPLINPAQWERELSTAQRNRSAPFWKQFDEMVIPITDDLKEILDRPTMKSAVREGVRAMKDRKEPVYNRFEDELGKEVLVPTARVFQRAKMKIDDKIERAVREGNKSLIGDYTKLKADLVKAVDNHPDPNVRNVWREARETWTPEEELKSAFALGENLLSSKLHWSEVPYLLDGMSSPEIRAIKNGLRVHFADLADSKGSDLKEINEALGGANRKKISAVLGGENADKLFNSYESEQRMRYNRNEITKGAQTSERQLYRDLFNPPHRRKGADSEAISRMSLSLKDIPKAILHAKHFV